MWIIPSRSRPQNISRLVKAFRETLATTPVLLWLDNDDPRFLDYMDTDFPPQWTVAAVNRRSGLGKIYNDVFRKHPDLEWYGFLADDVVPETIGWDAALIRAAGLTGVSYGDDSINGEAFGTHIVVGGNLAREIGWLALPGLKRLYIDTVWADIARERNVYYYLPHVKLTHKHFSNRKALPDAIYRKPPGDKAIYQTWKETA